MPATNPKIAQAQRAVLTALGAELSARRKELGISATTTAEAAGLSRVTLHRIERGNPAVTIGAYLNVAAALGLRLGIVDPVQSVDGPERDLSQVTIRIGDLPQLRQIAWQLSDDTEISEVEALHLYERNWRHIDPGAFDDRERDFVQHLADVHSHGRLLV